MENELVRQLKEMRNKNARLSWKFVKENFKSEYFYCYRSESVEKDYKKYRKTIKDEWDDVSSLIKHEVFGMPSSVSKRFVGKQTVIAPIKGYYFVVFVFFADCQYSYVYVDYSAFEKALGKLSYL